MGGGAGGCKKVQHPSRGTPEPNREFHQEVYQRGGVFNREELLGTLHKALSGEGTFTLLLGGKNVGKSRVLQAVAEQYNEADKGPMVVAVNARLTGPDLGAGIVKAIQALEHAPRWRGILRDFHESGAATLGGGLAEFFASIPFVGMVIRALKGAQKKKEMTTEEAIASFVAVAEKRGRFPCLFVDEANIVFAVEKQEDKKEAKRILAMFTALTKQQRQLNVLLASSEHAYPFHLRQGLDFNLFNIGETVFAGEVPPVSMRKLLVNHWGMGEGLAGHCLATYGGHVWQTSMAISELSLRKEQFAAEHMVPIGLYGGIVQCLEAEAEHPGITDLMREVAVHGWVPIGQATDPRAEILSANNVAGVVDERSVVVGLPRTVWEHGHDYGLIPASQHARLMIGKVLSREGAL